MTTREGVATMQEVEIQSLQMDRFSDLLPPDRIIRFADVAAEARALMGGRTIWNVNATAQGGGVAEMLQTLLAYVRGVTSTPAGSCSPATRSSSRSPSACTTCCTARQVTADLWVRPSALLVADALEADIEELTARVSVGDVVLLHDPQTAGMVDRLRAAGRTVVWRCHVGRDTSNELTDRAWDFLRPMIQHADAFVFSRSVLCPGLVPAGGGAHHHPFDRSVEREEPGPQRCDGAAVLSAPESVEDGSSTVGDASLQFVRRDGRAGEVRRHHGLLADGPRRPR